MQLLIANNVKVNYCVATQVDYLTYCIAVSIDRYCSGALCLYSMIIVQVSIAEITAQPLFSLMWLFFSVNLDFRLLDNNVNTEVCTVYFRTGSRREDQMKTETGCQSDILLILSRL